MKKLFFPILAILAVGSTTFISSCKQDITDRFEYVASQDSMVPMINMSVPAMNQSYDYGNHVAIVGTVTDLESARMTFMTQGLEKVNLKAYVLK